MCSSDLVLIERNPECLDNYYRAIDGLDGELVQRTVNKMARGETDRLAGLIPRFHAEQFLRDYLDSVRLLYRLNQVMRRIKLRQLPDELADVFDTGREFIRERAGDLLSFLSIDVSAENTNYKTHR